MSQISSDRNRVTDLEADALRIVAAAQNDPNADLQAQIQNVERQRQAFEQEIRDHAGQLIQPQEMPAILREVLASTNGLSFVGLEGIGAEPLVTTADESGQTTAQTNAYRHGFRIHFSGSYLNTIEYLRALEELPWRFFWDAVDLDVTQHPNASASVVIYTLSLDGRWIGV